MDAQRSMKKEVFFAVLLGLTLGLIVTYGIYRASQANTQDQLDTITEGESEQAGQQEKIDSSSLVVDVPQDESVVNEATLTVSGTTLSNTFVIIYVGETPYITTADEAGAYSVSVELEEGSNIIGVHSLSENGQEVSTERLVTYTTQPLLPDTASESAKPESNS